MSYCVAIITLFNRWADDGEKNIRALMPQPLDVDFSNFNSNSASRYEFAKI
tara:strand:- start:471 stop:623 length:153 start_codon:yes stop_codon:yes gene_type:complete